MDSSHSGPVYIKEVPAVSALDEGAAGKGGGRLKAGHEGEIGALR